MMLPIALAMQNIPYTRYIAAFVPVYAIMATMGAWAIAIFAFHVIKVILRRAGIIK